jgi:hypothetical protein
LDLEEVVELLEATPPPELLVVLEDQVVSLQMQTVPVLYMYVHSEEVEEVLVTTQTL